MGQAGGRRRGVVVVVETLTRGQPRQPLEVAGKVVVRAATEVVTHGVHRRARSQVQVGVEERSDETGDGTEHPDEDADADAEPDECMVEQHPVPAVGREVLRVAGHGQRVVGLTRRRLDDEGKSHAIDLAAQETEDIV